MGKYESKKKLMFNFLLVMALSLMVALFAMPMAKAFAGWEDDYDDDDDDWNLYGSDNSKTTDDTEVSYWYIRNHAQNFKTTQDVYEADADEKCHVEVSFDLDYVPADAATSNQYYGLFLCQEGSVIKVDPTFSLDYECIGTFSCRELKLTGNKFSVEFTPEFREGMDSEKCYLWLSEAEYNYFSYKYGIDDLFHRPDVTYEFTVNNNTFDIAKNIENFKVTESVITADEDDNFTVTVTFDLKEAPFKKADLEKTYCMLMGMGGSIDYPSANFKGSDLKKTGNTFTFNSSIFPGSSQDASSNKKNYNDKEEYYDFNITIYNTFSDYSKKDPLVECGFKVKRNPTIIWNVNDMITDVKLDKDFYSLGSEQKIVVTYNISEKENIRVIDNGSKVSFRIVDELGNVITEKETAASDMVIGSNQITLPCRFTTKGIYSLEIVQAGSESGQKSVYTNGPYTFGVQNAKSEDGSFVETNDSVSAGEMLYSKSQGSSLKVKYSISDMSSDYRLFVIKGNPSSYSQDTKNALSNADFLSNFGELTKKLGEEQTLNIKTTFNDFGIYTVILCNLTTKQMVAKANFYVVPEDNLIQRDISKMSDKGIVPFSCSADVFNMDLDTDKKITFNVEFPMNYNKYLKNIKKKYGKASDGLSSNYFSGKSGSNDDYGISSPQRDGSSNKDDDNPVTMTVKYCPAGSNKSRVLYKEMLVGIYKTHTIEISAQKLMDAIYATRGSDTAYAGVITVEFSNDPEDITDFYDDYDYNDFEYDDYDPVDEDIIKISEKFSFSVNKAIGIESATARSKTVERAYGEGAFFTVVDNLGGTIYADIYKGKKKITTLTANCELNNDGTAGGMVIWDLLNQKGKYAAKGSYKAKIYTKSEYTVYEEDGSQSKKSVKSDVKTISFKVKKPSGKLTLEASVSGANGNSVYIENPNVALQYSLGIGSKVSVNVKNSSGTSIYSDTFVAGKGTYSKLLNISGKNIKEGKYKVEVKATTMDGASKSVTASFDVKKMPKPAIESTSVSADSNTGSGSFSFKVTQPATVKVEVKSGSTVKQTVINQNYSAGTIKSSFSIGGYAAGKYDLVITATNSGGTVTTTKTFEVKKKPVVVKKPTVSNISVKFLAGKDGDKVQVNFNYTGKNSKVVIDFMYNDTEEIVYTYEGTTSKDSATFTYTWDGFKSNGFRAWAGSYTARVHLVNSAGSTDYLRQNFTIGVG